MNKSLYIVVFLFSLMLVSAFTSCGSKDPVKPSIQGEWRVVERVFKSNDENMAKRINKEILNDKETKDIYHYFTETKYSETVVNKATEEILRSYSGNYKIEGDTLIVTSESISKAGIVGEYLDLLVTYRVMNNTDIRKYLEQFGLHVIVPASTTGVLETREVRHKAETPTL